MRYFLFFLFPAMFLCTLLYGEETLREAAGNHLLVGCAIKASDLDSPLAMALIAKQCNCITPEYNLMPRLIVDDQEKFNFTDGDRIVAFAQSHHMPVFGHLLVWHHVSRKWLFEDTDSQPLPRKKALANLKKYIDTVVGHYRGKIEAWNVVNEAISDKDDEFLRDTPALRAIGPDYIEQAFKFANAAAPEAKFYYNDYNIEQSPKLERAIRLVQSLQDHGVRIDAVGIQGHWLLNWPATEKIEKGLDALAATGVKVMITELDVDVLPRDKEHKTDLDKAKTDKDKPAEVSEKLNPYVKGLPPEIQEKLAKRYGEIVHALVRHPAVTMINIWGTHDGRSWLNDFPIKGRTNYPLLYDRQYQPKPAFDAVRKALKTAKR